MSYKYHYLTNLFLCIPFISLAQREIEGTTLLNKTNTPFIDIINKTKHTYTQSDINGHFKLIASAMDTIYFRSIHTHEKEIILSDTILKQNHLEIHLENREYLLAEVLLKHRNLTGNLNIDLNNIPEKVNYTEKAGFKTPLKAPQEKIVSVGQALGYGIINNIDLEALTKHLNGYYKRLKWKRKRLQENKITDAVILKFGKDFFVERYHLQEDQVYVFVNDIIAENREIVSYWLSKNESQVLQIIDMYFEQIYKTLQE